MGKMSLNNNSKNNIKYNFNKNRLSIFYPFSNKYSEE